MAKQPIHIQFTRFSAFYSPLIATIAGGFLQEEGFEARYSVAPAGRSAIAGLLDGSVHVAQSAPSQGFTPLEQGEKPKVVHFAQINERDGFFITARAPDPAFTWQKLASAKVLVDHGGQPLVMFQYACHKQGVEFKSLQAIDAGVEKMDEAFRSGTGDYIHQQGPAPQQLEHDKVGAIVARVGDAIGPIAFSSLAATPAWLATPEAKQFMRAYRKARSWVIETPASRIAEAERLFSPVFRFQYWQVRLQRIRHSDAGLRMSKSPAPRSRRPWTPTSTPDSSHAAIAMKTWSQRRPLEQRAWLALR